MSNLKFLGLKEDYGFCDCPNDFCIMDNIMNVTNTHFSVCNIEDLQNEYKDGKYFCMINKREAISSDFSTCGNGILEYDEECDLGFSTNSASHCCNISTCTLKNNSQCSTGTCCDLNVSFSIEYTYFNTNR